MYEVKDGARTLQFEGRQLAASSSWRRGSERWIEFSLYKTTSGLYILSRVGVSQVFHVSSCYLVKKYELNEIPVTDLRVGASPCAECQPTLSAPYVFPEKYREWAQVSEEAGPVLEALYKYDEGGIRYLTKVAERLLEQAADVDQDIENIYRVELIP